MSETSDVFSEEDFYENMTLGAVKLLEETNGVTNVELVKREPSDKPSITAWEQRYCNQLPKDVRNFYLSADGFQLTWSYDYAGELLNVGNMYINSLSSLRRLYGIQIRESELVSLDLDLDIIETSTNKPSFNSNCKIFELDSSKNVATVCLVFMEECPIPSVWLLDRSFDWHFVADSFTQYFRMMLVFQGLPEWQFKFTPMGMSPWAEQLMYAFAPHLNLPTPTQKLWSPTEVQIDPSLFKTKTKSRQHKPDSLSKSSEKKGSGKIL